MTTTDVHTHFLPEAMITTLRSGQTWHGWDLSVMPDGGEALRSAAGVAPFPLTDEAWADRIERRHREGSIEVQAIMLPAFLWNYHLPNHEAAAFCRDVNDEMIDLSRTYPDAIVPMGVLPLQDRDLAIGEIERTAGRGGIQSYAIGTHVEGQNLDHPDVASVLETACEAGASIMIHASYFNRAGATRMSGYDFGNSIGVPLEAGLALFSVVYSGLLDRHPNARIGSCHGGGWAAYGVGRLWLRYTQGRDGGHLQQEPAEYLTKLYYDCLLHDDLSLELLVRRVGSSQVMIGSDYPFKGDQPGGSVAWIERSDFLTDDEKVAILEKNATRFLGRTA